MSRLLLVTITSAIARVLLVLIRQQPSVAAPAVLLLQNHMLFAASSDVANCSPQRDALLARMTNGTLGGSRCAAQSAHELLAKAVSTVGGRSD